MQNTRVIYKIYICMKIPNLIIILTTITTLFV